MNAKMSRRGFIALGATAVLGAAVASTALAQQTPPTPQAPWGGPMGPGMRPWGGSGPGMGLGAGPGSMHQAIASALGMSTDELFAELRSGKTVAQIAQEKGVDLDTVIEEAEKAHDEALDTQLQAGRLTKEQADWMDAHMESNIRAMFSGQVGPGTMGGPGFGPGGPGAGSSNGPGWGPGMGPGRRGPGMMPGFGPRRRGQ